MSTPHVVGAGHLPRQLLPNNGTVCVNPDLSDELSLCFCKWHQNSLTEASRCRILESLLAMPPHPVSTSYWFYLGNLSSLSTFLSVPIVTAQSGTSFAYAWISTVVSLPVPSLHAIQCPETGNIQAFLCSYLKSSKWSRRTMHSVPLVKASQYLWLSISAK